MTRSELIELHYLLGKYNKQLATESHTDTRGKLIQVIREEVNERIEKKEGRKEAQNGNGD